MMRLGGNVEKQPFDFHRGGLLQKSLYQCYTIKYVLILVSWIPDLAPF